ncbi:MAG: signal peptidase II [Candidatus Gracilibacteria bacterium]|nr:signal peptidase II [Candidatus Gracilibacteria bacterium]
MESFLLNGNISLIGDFLSLKLVRNTGIAFSLPIEGVPLKIMTIILIISIYFYYMKYESKKDNMKDILYGLVLGGAIGNGFERVFHGSVVDFISLKYFAIFNFADIFINVGIILLIFSYLKNESRRN